METSSILPPLRHYFGEARLAGDWLRGRLSEDVLASRWPGDGRTVIVVPGLFTTDSRTALLRRVLKKAKYDVHGWGLGRNMPVRANTLDRFDAHVIDCGQGQPVALVGWSLGGIIAREYAKVKPDQVSQVITLGSPFSGDVRDNRAWRFYELAADHKVDAAPLMTDRSGKPPVPTTAIWSRRDGIVAAHSARGAANERDTAIEISCGHLAMSSAPDAIEAVLKALASLPAKAVPAGNV